jgi:hypothetical protein
MTFCDFVEVFIVFSNYLMSCFEELFGFPSVSTYDLELESCHELYLYELHTCLIL